MEKDPIRKRAGGKGTMGKVLLCCSNLQGWLPEQGGSWIMETMER